MTHEDEYQRRAAHLEKLHPSQMLAELLAVIHGDGGQYTETHGFAKAVADAEVKWHERTSGVDSVDGGKQG